MDTTHVPSEARKLTPLKGFVSVFVAVFLIIFSGSAVVTYMLPETFLAVSRVQAASTEVLVDFQSEAVLEQVSRQLDLPRLFARRFGENEALAADRTKQMLRRMLQVRVIPKTRLAEIRVYSRNPDEAALLANAVAEAGLSSPTAASGRAAIVEKATPPRKPVRPNKPLNLFLGALVGLVLGAMAGGVGARLAVGVDPEHVRTSR